MDCQQVQEWLFRTDVLHPESVDHEHAAHIDSCVDCRGVAAGIKRLEQDWRDMPLPASALAAKAKFLTTLDSGMRKPQSVRFPARRLVLRSALAASILLAASVGGLLLLDLSRASASARLVDRLVDWNLELADASSITARAEIYDEQGDSLRNEVAGANLPDTERAFAQELLTNAAWLSENNDPIAEADRFAAVSQSLLERMELARKNNNSKELRRLIKLYARVTKLGVEPKLKKILIAGGLDFEHMRRLEKIVLKDKLQRQKLESLLERSPDATRKQIKKELEIPRKTDKRKNAGG
jgi:hypothetical protein